jgi:hypothetical protein
MTLSGNTFHEPTCVGVTVVPSAVPLVSSEAGGGAVFAVVLDSEPTAVVTIGVSSDDLTEGTVSTGLLTFTVSDWATAQTVTVSGVDDSVVDGDVAYTVVLAAALGGDYAGTDPVDVAATNSDNDTVGGGLSPVDVVLPPAGLVDTSSACPVSMASSTFMDLTGLDHHPSHRLHLRVWSFERDISGELRAERNRHALADVPLPDSSAAGARSSPAIRN